MSRQIGARLSAFTAATFRLVSIPTVTGLGAICFIAIPLSAVAEEACPVLRQPVQTTPYVKETACPRVAIVAIGRSYPVEYADCLSDVPSQKENVFFHGADGIDKPLPTVLSMLARSPDSPIPSSASQARFSEYNDFKSRTWIVSEVQCNDRGGVSVVYWGGGNCHGCERIVEYRFSERGTLSRSVLRSELASDRK